MKQTKHITQVFMIMLILLTIAACGKKSENKATKKTTSKTEKDTREDLNSPETATSDAIITPVIDRQIIDRTDTKVNAALNAYYSVLMNQSEYIDTYSNKSTSINQELDNYYTPNQLKLARFAVLDLDDDKLPEIVLAYTNTADYDSISDHFYNILYYILYYRDGRVYSIGALSNRQFGLLKADGSFHWSGSASNWGYATISFVKNEDEDLPYTYNNLIYQNYYEQNPETGEWTGYDLIVNQKHVTKEELDLACKEQDNKPDITWHEFTEASIEKYFSE